MPGEGTREPWGCFGEDIHCLPNQSPNNGGSPPPRKSSFALGSSKTTPKLIPVSSTTRARTPSSDDLNLSVLHESTRPLEATRALPERVFSPSPVKRPNLRAPGEGTQGIPLQLPMPGFYSRPESRRWGAPRMSKSPAQDQTNKSPR